MRRGCHAYRSLATETYPPSTPPLAGSYSSVFAGMTPFNVSLAEEGDAAACTCEGTSRVTLLPKLEPEQTA
eukprot:2902093-Rhodomonas_salina.4